jgi:hypothetical protein
MPSFSSELCLSTVYAKVLDVEPPRKCEAAQWMNASFSITVHEHQYSIIASFS